MKINNGDRVYILAGDERGSWGIVKLISHGIYHVGIAGSDTDVRVYERNEIRKPRPRR